MGTIFKPNKTLNIDCYVDADFAGLHQVEPDTDATSAKSRGAYIIMIGNCLTAWKTKIQSCILLSTLESEYQALSDSMHAIIPLKNMLIELNDSVKLNEPFFLELTVSVHEDLSGALSLA